MNFEEIGKKVKRIGKDTVEEVQRLNEIRILKGKISSAKKQINETYNEMGKRLYEQYKDTAFEGFESEIDSITEALAQIEKLKEQVRDVKGVVLCPCCNTEVSAGEKFCANCGNKMPETEAEEDIVDADFEVVKDDADVSEEENIESVKDTAEGEAVIEKAEDAAEIAVEETEDAAEIAVERTEDAVETVLERAEDAVETAAE